MFLHRVNNTKQNIKHNIEHNIEHNIKQNIYTGNTGMEHGMHGGNLSYTSMILHMKTTQMKMY